MKIVTNLNRSIILYLVLVLLSGIIYLLVKTIGFLAIFCLSLVFFLQFLFNKQLFSISVNKEIVTFCYLLLIKRSKTYNKNDLKVNLKSKVQYRGGKIELIEVYDTHLRKKVFEIDKRIFKESEQFKKLYDFLSY